MRINQTSLRFAAHRVSHLVFALFVPTISFHASFASADEPTPHICIGFNPSKQDFNPVAVRGDSTGEENCPPGFAYLSQHFPTGRERPGRKISVQGACCPLPDGVLTEEQVWELEECPQDFVATGGKSERSVVAKNDADMERAGTEWEGVDQYFRCTKIDTSRFQLSSPVETLTIGFNEGFTWNTLMRSFTTPSRIPPGLRYGVARGSRLAFDVGGCIGFPWGALLTKKIHKLCGFEFRQLQYKGIVGDPPEGSPVRVFPDCLSVDDRLSPEPRCIR